MISYFAWWFEFLSRFDSFLRTTASSSQVDLLCIWLHNWPWCLVSCCGGATVKWADGKGGSRWGRGEVKDDVGWMSGDKERCSASDSEALSESVLQEEKIKNPLTHTYTHTHTGGRTHWQNRIWRHCTASWIRPGSNCIRACRSNTGVHGPDCEEEEEEEEAGARLGKIR